MTKETSRDEIINDLRGFMVTRRLIRADRELTPEESLLEGGVIDSLAVMELSSYAEERYGIEVSEDDLVPENFDSLAAMSAYIESRRSA